MMQVGGMNIVQSIINLEVQVEMHSQLIEKLGRDIGLTQSQVDQMRQIAQQRVKDKYPELGINFS